MIIVKYEIKFAHYLPCLRKVYYEMVSNYYKIRNKSRGNISIKPFQLYQCVYRMAFCLFLNSAIQIILEICLVAIIVLCGVVTTIESTQAKILPHVGILRFYSPRNKLTMMFFRG